MAHHTLCVLAETGTDIRTWISRDGGGGSMSFESASVASQEGVIRPVEQFRAGGRVMAFRLREHSFQFGTSF